MVIDKVCGKLSAFFIPCERNQFRPEFLRSKFLYYYAILLIVLKLIIIPVMVALPKTVFFADLTKNSLFMTVNDTRVSLGYTPLKESTVLNEAAQLKAQDMMAKDYFAHNSPDGKTPWYWFEEVGYNFKLAGENLAIGFLDSEEVSQAWMDSPSHRKNLLKPEYSEVGYAVLTGEYEGRETTVVVQLFGTPQARVLAVAEPVETEIPLVEETPPPQEETQPTEQIAETPETSTPTQIAQTEQNQQPLQSIQTGQVLSAYREPAERGFSFSLFSFMSSDYYDLLQKILYGSLFFIILSLLVTVFFDIFVYHAYEIQYKDIFFKTISFSILLLVLISVDKSAILGIIPHEFSIY